MSKTMDELLEIIGNAPIQFWTCRCSEKPAIHWVKSTAICQQCGNTNTAQALTQERDLLQSQLSKLDAALTAAPASSEH